MTNSAVAEQRHEQIGLNADPPAAPANPPRRSLLATGLALLAICVALVVVWQTAASLLIIFAGVLFAAFLDAAAMSLAPVVPLRRGLRLALVLLLLAVLLGFGLRWGAGKLPEQTRVLVSVMTTQLDVVRERLLAYDMDLLGPAPGRDFSQWLFADQVRLLSHAQTVVGGASSVLTSALLVVFVGVMFAFDPASYRESLVALVKRSYRTRARAVLDEMGNVLRLWFVGQLIRVVLMALCVWAALYLMGLPGPFVLGLQAGLSNFVPYLGPIVAAIPIALVAMPLGASMLIWAVAIYTIIQSIEGYVIGPLIQQRAVEIPPGWTLAAIVLLGASFGVMGIALAMPLVAVGRIAVVRFYVEDYLGDRAGERSTAAGRVWIEP
jgi:predicted PurR-regulated permease PerM